MGACARRFILPLAALCLAAAPLKAQDAGPHDAGPHDIPSIEQPPSQPLPDVGTLLGCSCGHSVWFEADWLWTSHAGMWGDTRNFIDGPDATSFTSLPAFSGDNGYRFQGGIHVGDWLFEAVYSHYGQWQSSLNQNVNGVAFNAAGIAGNWAGENSINANTYFAPIANAASLTSPANTAGDQLGIGPSTAFTTDARPSLLAYSHSEFYMTEATVKGADYLFAIGNGGLRLGAGYVNANLTNDSWVALSGTFRDSNSGGSLVGLPGSVLTAPTGGNLVLYSGGGAGFSANGTPSQLRFVHDAQTRNELNGAQVVLDWDMLQYHQWDFSMGFKAGIFDNFAQGAVSETYVAINNDQSSYSRQFTADCHHLAFLGGVGVNGRFHLTNEIALCGGYDVLFLTNQALGPEQINGISNSWYHVQTNGSAVIQAVNMGLEIAY